MKKLKIILSFCLIFCLIIFANNLHIIKDAVYAEESTKDVKILVKDLKTTLTSKDKYILKQEDDDFEL